MIKERLLSMIGSMEGPSGFADYRDMLSAHVNKFPSNASLPRDPGAAYGHVWDQKFSLPHSPVGVEDDQSLIILKDSVGGCDGLDAERNFLFIQPLPKPPFPVDFYLAWGKCRIVFSASPLRMNAGIERGGHWFVGEEGSEFENGLQMASAMQKCESMIPPGITTAFEQIAYLNHASKST